MTYLPVTNNIGVNMTLGATMDSANSSYESPPPQAQQPIRIILVPDGNYDKQAYIEQALKMPVLTIPQPPPREIEYLPFFGFALFIAGFATMMAGLAWPKKVRNTVFVVVWSIWGTAGMYCLFSHIGVG